MLYPQSATAIILPRILNLQHLNAVLQVSRLGSISRAAEHVHRSQSALTMAIRTIERAIGDPLFERHATGMSLTDAGRALVSRVERAFGCLEQGVQGLPARKRRHSSSLLCRAITSTQLRALVAIVQQGGFSSAARHLGLSQPSVQRAARDLETVLDTPLFRVGAAGVAEPTREATALARFASLEWVMPRPGTPAREHIAAYFSRKDVIAPNRIVECSSLVTTRQLLLSSDIGLTTRIGRQPTPVQAEYVRLLRPLARQLGN